ncbi:MAG: guanylate kinase, partial [Mycoplasmataceae bacterium]|nr:guanylate kinase [Mycoplasmataceae bacterium]
DNEEQIKKRLERAIEEIPYKKYFQNVVENDDVNETIDKIKKIIKNKT